MSASQASDATLPLIMAVLVAASTQLLVGYNIGVMNAPEKVVFPGHSTAEWSLAVAAFAIGGPFGSMAGGKLADSRGRTGALMIDIWTFLVGGLLQTFAVNMFMITVARFIIGFASGFATVVGPVYLGEISPLSMRGLMGTMTQFGIVTGILVADFFAFPFATENGWRFLFAITPIVALIQVLFSTMLLESPKWLLNRDPDSLRARYIIKNLQGIGSDSEVEAEIAALTSGQGTRQEAPNQGLVLRELICSRKLRRLFFSSVALQMGQQLCGINAVFYYSTSFFEGVIEDPLVGTTVVGAVNVLATYVAMRIMDSCGRRTLILWSSGGMFLCCVMIVMSLLGFLSNVLAFVAVCFYVTFFELGLGPIPWLVVSEMFEGKYVAVAMSVCSIVNWGCNVIVGFFFPFMNKYLGPYSFVPFAAVLLLVFLFALTILPETQGTTPDRLMVEMVRQTSKSSLESEGNDTKEEEKRLAHQIV